MKVENLELDNLDIKFLRENFDDDSINKIDMDNIFKIIMYMKKVYYQKKTRNWNAPYRVDN